MTMKSINIEMNAAKMLTAIIQLEGLKKQPIMVCAMVAYRVSDSWVSTAYTLSTSEDFTFTGDGWDVSNALRDHSPLMQAVWEMIRPVLELNCPKPLTGNEQAEKDNSGPDELPEKDWRP
jgi:hypothetical protein